MYGDLNKMLGNSISYLLKKNYRGIGLKVWDLVLGAKVPGFGTLGFG